MSTFKTRLFDICSEVVSEFQNWTFSSGQFKNSTLKHTTLVIDLGFSFRNGNTSLGPSIRINQKKSMRLFKKLNGYELNTSIVSFQTIAQMLEHMPDDLRTGAHIFEDKKLEIAMAPPSELARKCMIDITEARSVLRCVMMDGIELINKLYDLSSEESLLRNLPAKYTTRSSKMPYDEYEMQKGVMVCIVRALMGDFEFVENYRSDSYKTIFPKRLIELNNVVAALPDWKRQYAESGKIV